MALVDLFVQFNAKENGESLNVCDQNMLGNEHISKDFDLILAGDICYDEAIATVAHEWLGSLAGPCELETIIVHLPSLPECALL